MMAVSPRPPPIAQPIKKFSSPSKFSHSSLKSKSGTADAKLAPFSSSFSGFPYSLSSTGGSPMSKSPSNKETSGIGKPNVKYGFPSYSVSSPSLPSGKGSPELKNSSHTTSSAFGKPLPSHLLLSPVEGDSYPDIPHKKTHGKAYQPSSASLKPQPIILKVCFIREF
jgi:hypothetical protein